MEHSGHAVASTNLALRPIQSLAHAQLQAQAAYFLLKPCLVSCQHSLLCVGLLKGCRQHLDLVLPNESLRLHVI